MKETAFFKLSIPISSNVGKLTLLVFALLLQDMQMMRQLKKSIPISSHLGKLKLSVFAPLLRELRVMSKQMEKSIQPYPTLGWQKLLGEHICPRIARYYRCATEGLSRKQRIFRDISRTFRGTCGFKGSNQRKFAEIVRAHVGDCQTV